MKKVSSKLLLRLAATIMLLHLIGHTAGFSRWQKPGGVVPQDVIQIMQERRFEVQGQYTTMADSFSGSGFTNSIFLLLMVCILWISSNRTGIGSSGILWASAFALALLAINEFTFYFPAVAVLTSTASLFTFLAVARMNQMARVQQA